MTNSTAPAVIFWDFDGTLATREGMWRGALLSALEQTAPGQPVDALVLRQGLRDGFPWHQPDVGHAHLTTEDLWWAAITPVFEAAYVSAGVPAESASTAAAVVRHHYCDPATHSLAVDALAVLGDLRAEGWRHFVVSNHVFELPVLLGALGLSELLSGVVCSAVVGWEKPHPKIFASALALAGHPETSWFVGDNPVADIEGATAAGISAILVGRETGVTLSDAAEIIKRSVGDS